MIESLLLDGCHGSDIIAKFLSKCCKIILGCLSVLINVFLVLGINQCSTKSNSMLDSSIWPRVWDVVSWVRMYVTGLCSTTAGLRLIGLVVTCCKCLDVLFIFGWIVVLTSRSVTVLFSCWACWAVISAIYRWTFGYKMVWDNSLNQGLSTYGSRKKC